MLSHQTYQKCSSWSTEEVLLSFRAIRNPKWPPCIESDWLRTTACEFSRLARDGPLGVLKNSHYSSDHYGVTAMMVSLESG